MNSPNEVNAELLAWLKEAYCFGEMTGLVYDSEGLAQRQGSAVSGVLPPPALLCVIEQLKSVLV
jgi:hypothetical protein